MLCDKIRNDSVLLGRKSYAEKVVSKTRNGVTGNGVTA